MRTLALLLLAVLCATSARADENLVSGLSQEFDPDHVELQRHEHRRIRCRRASNRHETGHRRRPPRPAERYAHPPENPYGRHLGQQRPCHPKRMPGYYFAASTRPLNQIASVRTLLQYDLGLAAVEPHGATGPKDIEPFRQALLASRSARALYREMPGACSS